MLELVQNLLNLFLSQTYCTERAHINSLCALRANATNSNNIQKMKAQIFVSATLMLLSALQGSAETMVKVKGTENHRHLRRRNRGGGIGPPKHQAKKQGPKGGHGGGGPNISPSDPRPGSACFSSPNEEACRSLIGCSWTDGRCVRGIGWLDSEDEEFDSEDFELELLPDADEIDSADYDDEDEDYYEDNSEDEDEEDADIMMSA